MKTGILDEFVAVTGMRRKAVIQLLNRCSRPARARIDSAIEPGGIDIKHWIDI